LMRKCTRRVVRSYANCLIIPTKALRK
jgi:hypothetical protein